jgi:hypothetical protein
MSEIVEIKVRIDVQKKVRYDRHIEALRVSRNVRLNELIDADLEGRIASERVLPLPPKTISEAEQIRADHARLLQSLDELFAKNRETMGRLLKPLQSVASVAITEKRFDAVDGSNKKLAEQLTLLNNAVVQSSETNTQAFGKMHKALKIERPDWQSDSRTRSGFAAGILVLLLAIALLPSSCTPTRAIAKLAMGESDSTHAGARLAGQGDKAAEATVLASLQLSKDDAFLASYKACIETAKRSTKRSICQLSMPPLK